MIVQALLSLLSTIVNGILALIPPLPVPSWMGGIAGDVNQLTGYASDFGQWVDWSVLMAVATSVFACVAVAFAIKLVRVVLSLFTGGGGSAA